MCSIYEYLFPSAFNNSITVTSNISNITVSNASNANTSQEFIVEEIINNHERTATWIMLTLFLIYIVLVWWYTDALAKKKKYNNEKIVIYCYTYTSVYRFDKQNFDYALRDSKFDVDKFMKLGIKGFIYTSPTGHNLLVTNKPISEYSMYLDSEYSGNCYSYHFEEKLRNFYGWSIRNGMYKYIKENFLYQEKLKYGIDDETYESCFKEFVKNSEKRKTLDILSEVEQLNPDAPKFDKLPSYKRLGQVRLFNKNESHCYSGNVLHNLMKNGTFPSIMNYI